MFHPDSAFISAWTIVALVLLVEIAITVPVIIAFTPIFPQWYIGVNVTIDVFYLVDIFVTFRTGWGVFVFLWPCCTFS